jgi:heme/copper-type cytochrome/quinol oxidase subunit 1
MATTDTVTEAVTSPPTDKPAGGPSGGATGFAVPAPAGLLGLVGSGDHKTIGRLWIGSSALFGAGSLGLFGWFALEASADAASQTGRAPQNLTLAVLGLVLGFALPMLIGLATVVVPLQVGASTIAFPRAAAAALWTWLLSGVLLAVSYLPALDGGVGGTRVDGSVLTEFAIIGLVASLLLGAICVMTTVVTLRPAGMSLDRVPLFSWSMLVAGGVWLLSLPVLAANAAFIAIDLEYGAPARFGAPEAQWGQLSWLVTPPQVFALALPVLGILGDIVTTFAKRSGGRRPLAGRGAVLIAIGAAGALSFGAYAQHAFDPLVYRQWAYIAQVAIVVLPLLALLGGYASALRRGTSAVAAPLVLGFTALLLVLLGAIAAVLFIVSPLDLQSTDTALLEQVPALRTTTTDSSIYTWGVFGLVLAGAVTGFVAGMFHWAAKVSGRPLPDAIGKLLALVLLAGGVLLGGPFLALGFAPDGVVDSRGTLFLVSLAGALVTLAGVAVTLVLALAARSRRAGDPDPWGTGVTLEWATDSPPPAGNFAAVPAVASSEPLLDAAGGEPDDGGAR